MLLSDIFDNNNPDDILEGCEVVYLDSDGNELLDENAIRQFKMVGGKIEKRFRCLAGPKAGRLVSKPGDCGVRKDPKKIRAGRRVMQQKGAIIRRKGSITKKRAGTKRVAKMNQLLSKK